MRVVGAALFAWLAGCGRSGFDEQHQIDANDAAVDADTPADAGPPTGLYVASSDSNEILFFAATANGDVSPTGILAGTTSGITEPLGIFLDVSHGELYSANFYGQFSIRVFALGALGDIAPVRTLIDGPTSRLFEPRKAIVDVLHDEMIVVAFDDAVRVYPRTANGDVAPLREIKGAATMLTNPDDIVLDPINDELYVNTYATGLGVVVFDRTANGNVAPKRTLVPQGHVAFDATNRELFLASGSEIDVFDPTGSQTRQLVGPSTQLANLGPIVVDLAHDRIEVTRIHQNAEPVTTNEVYAFSRTATGDTAPLVVLSGTSTLLNSAYGLAAEPGGGLLGP